MRILTWKDFIALGQTSAKARRFFSKEALAAARRIVPEFYAVAESDVQKALAFPETSAQSKSGKKSHKGKRLHN
jgi:hypothetical protein